jgi:ankyrin repeat protein
MGAALNGHLEVLQLLLARGAALVERADVVNGATAFQLACATNQPGCAEGDIRLSLSKNSY